MQRLVIKARVHKNVDNIILLFVCPRIMTCLSNSRTLFSKESASELYHYYRQLMESFTSKMNLGLTLDKFKSL